MVWNKVSKLLLGATASVVLHPLAAQSPTTPRSLITERVDATRMVLLSGNVRSEARSAALNPANDLGPVSATLPLDHMLLQLQRAPEKEAELAAFIDQLHTKGSPSYHQWITPQQLRQQFGPTDADLAAVTSWLTTSGFTVNTVSANGMVVDFSGTAAHVRNALHTDIRRLNVAGVEHIANTQDPQIPAALAGVVKGVVSLHDFRPHMLHKAIAAAHTDKASGAMVTPDYTYTSGNSTYQAVVPGDLATIYNLNPLFAAGISGQGQTIVVIEDTNVYSTADWTTFRNTFGLASYTSGSFTQVHPGSGCTNPGVNGDDGEAILDAEWASAAAPSATIELASCADTRTTFGGLIALNNIVNAPNPPRIVSISYGECESENGAAANAAYNSAYQAAAAAGISVFVSAGDEGAASCDAKSYIPEIPWNDSCASSLLATFYGYSTTYGTSGFCNSTTGKKYFLTTGSGSGGPSSCATGSASITGVTSGSCKGYAKPSYQSLLGVPADGVRDLPDVSLFAANGVWGHYFVYCYTDPNNGGTPCTGAPSGWSGAGGTSFASPILAAVQALVNQKTGSASGNPNYRYYQLAATEYGSTGAANCNSTNGNGVAASCIFRDITQGDMDVNCTGTYGCYRPSGTYGVLSTSTTAYKKAYGTNTGWDFATGIGSINAANLVNSW